MNWEEHPEDGDCFKVALRLALSDPSFTLVHGLVVATEGSPVAGTRIWHAWVEQTRAVEVRDHLEPALLEYCIDHSNGQTLEVPAAVYYWVGHIEKTWRYTRDQILTNIDTHGTYGPWATPEQDTP